MSVYSENIIQQVLENLDIIKVLELINYRTDTIQKRIESVKCFCPIHKEAVFRTLMINTKDKSFKCSYSLCPGNKGGDLIALYALSLELDYDTALKELVKDLELKVELPAAQELFEKTIALAENYLELGIYDEAEKNFLKLLEMQPNNLAVRRGLVELYTETAQEERLREQILALIDALLANNEFEECINYCLQLLEKGPENLEVKEKLIEAYRGIGNIESFVGEAMNLADNYIEQGRYADALRIYQKIEEAKVDIIDVHTHEIQVLVAMGQREEAVKIAIAHAESLIAQQEYEKALYAYREAIELDDSRDDLRQKYIELAITLPLSEERIISCARVADELRDRGMFGEAAAVLEKICEKVPRNVFLLEKLIEIYRQQGRQEKEIATQRRLIGCLIERREFNKARRIIEELISITPAKAEIFLLLSEIEKAEGKIEEAVEAYKQAAEIFYQQNRVDEAIKTYDEISKYRPEDLTIKEAQIQFYIEAGKNEEGYAKCLEVISILEQRGESKGVIEKIQIALSLVPGAIEMWLKLAELLRKEEKIQEAKEAYFQAHKRYCEAGNHTAALTQLQRILELDADDIRALRGMAEIQCSLGDDASAFKYYKRAGELLFARGEFTECEEVLKQSLAIDPNNLTTLNRMAEVYEQTRQQEALREIWQKLIELYQQHSAFGRVLEICQKLLAIEPQDIFALRNMAIAYESTQRLDSAIECYYRLANLYAIKQDKDNQELMLERILEKQPQQLQAREELVWLLLNMGKQDAAIEQVKELIAHYKGKEDYESAVRTLSQLLERAPGEERLQLMLLEIYEGTGKTRQFVAQAIQLIEILRRQARHAEVAAWYKRVLQYEPDNVNFRQNLIESLQAQEDSTGVVAEYFALAEWYEGQENYEDAIETYHKLLLISPEDEGAHRSLIRLYKELADYPNATREINALAEIYQRGDKLNQAIETLKLVLEYEPGNIETHRKIIEIAQAGRDLPRALEHCFAIYDIYFRQEDYESAAGVQREAIKIRPDDPALREALIKALISGQKTKEAVAELFNLAGIYGDRGEYEKVLQTCSQILEHEPENMRARRLKAQTYLNLGDEKKALAEFIQFSLVFDHLAMAGAELKEEELAPRLKVMKEYTFENFVVGEHNHFAYATSMSVARVPAKNYNPLFLYADVGLGKTHLLHAIANYTSENRPELRTIYTNAEEFTSELVAAIQNNRVTEFRHKYSSADILLLDDVHFLAGKERAQEEFFHIFNTLFQAKKQIVVTSDRPPKDIPHLEKRLKSRFGAGVIVDIQSPEFELRLAILRKELSNHPEIEIPDNVINLIAERIEWNVRELKGALKQVIALKEIAGEELTEERVRQVLDSLFETV